MTAHIESPAARSAAVRPSEALPVLAVLGGTRGIGRCLVEQALARGHRVHVLVRDPARLGLEHPKLTVFVGDATDVEANRRLVRGSDAVVVALGAPALSRSTVRSVGTAAVARAMELEGVRRLLAVSVLGAQETRKHLPFFLKYLVFPLYLRRAVREHELQEQVLEESALDWTVVRPPTLTDGPLTGDYAHGFDGDYGALTLNVSRADVADFVLAELEQGRYPRRAAAISYRRAA